MLSYTQRRRRWWRVLTELDPSIALSEGLRMELMLELSGLSRQEVLVVKACAATKDFEGVAKVLVDQYSGIHVREGSRSWNGRAFTPQSYRKPGKGYGGSKGSQSGKGSYKTAYNAYLDEEGYGEYDEYQEEYFEEAGGIEKNTLQNSTLHTPITPLKHTTFMMKLMSMRQQP